MSKLADFYNMDRESACDKWQNFKYEVQSAQLPFG